MRESREEYDEIDNNDSDQKVEQDIEENKQPKLFSKNPNRDIKNLDDNPKEENDTDEGEVSNTNDSNII